MRSAQTPIEGLSGQWKSHALAPSVTGSLHPLLTGDGSPILAADVVLTTRSIRVNVLIVYAHPEAKSFNGAMRDVAVATLEQTGHQVIVSDLYAMSFNPVVGLDDFGGER